MSWVELAERVSLSPSACQRRARQLHDRGVISRFTLDVDLQAMGYDVEAFVAVSIERQNMKYAAEFRRAIAGLPEVRECHMLNGEIDFILKIVSEDLQSFQEFLTGSLTPAPNVDSVKTSLTIRTAKHEPGVPL